MENVDRVGLHKFVERELEVEAFPGRDGDVDALAHLGHLADVFLGDWFLEPERPVLFEPSSQMNGCVHVELGVDLDEYLDILSDSFPYGGDAILGELRLLWEIV